MCPISYYQFEFKFERIAIPQGFLRMRFGYLFSSWLLSRSRLCRYASLAMISEMQVKKLTELATLPTRGSAFAAGISPRIPDSLKLMLNAPYLYPGFDLSSAYDLVVPKGGKAIVKTDLAIAIPENTYARVGET